MLKKSNKCDFGLIHLIGLVFQGGLGIPLFSDGRFSDDDASLIYSLCSAVTSFASGVITSGGHKERSELISGDYRLVVYNPFMDLTVDVTNGSVDKYVLMSVQDIYDNLEVSFGKLIEIHRQILPLGLDKPNASIGFMVPDQVKTLIARIAKRTQVFPEKQKGRVQKLFDETIRLRNNETAILALIIADIDGGLITSSYSNELVEDPAFTELLLANMVAENPADAISVWIEKPGSISILSCLKGFPTKNVVEIFAMLQVGNRKISDFRLLVRAVSLISHRDELREQLKNLSNNLGQLLMV